MRHRRIATTSPPKPPRPATATDRSRRDKPHGRRELRVFFPRAIQGSFEHQVSRCLYFARSTAYFRAKGAANLSAGCQREVEMTAWTKRLFVPGATALALALMALPGTSPIANADSGDPRSPVTAATGGAVSSVAALPNSAQPPWVDSNQPIVTGATAEMREVVEGEQGYGFLRLTVDVEGLSVTVWRVHSLAAVDERLTRIAKRWGVEVGFQDASFSRSELTATGRSLMAANANWMSHGFAITGWTLTPGGLVLDVEGDLATARQTLIHDRVVGVVDSPDTLQSPASLQ